jgi:hypothetical protein
VSSEFVHLAIAARAGTRIGWAPEHRSWFAPGSVAPDVSNLLGLPRGATHFRNPPAADDVSGAGLLAAHPQLAARGLDPPERAFVAGYLCHLVTDEQEGLAIGRPHLQPYLVRSGQAGPGSRAGRDLRAALIVELETALAASDPGLPRAVAGLRAAVAAAGAGPDGLREGLLPFVRTADVRAWGALVLVVAGLPPGPERLLRFRSLPPAPVRREGVADDFLERYPALAAEVRRAVPAAAVRAFEDRAVGESVAVVEAYLDGRPLPTPASNAARDAAKSSGRRRGRTAP